MSDKIYDIQKKLIKKYFHLYPQEVAILLSNFNEDEILTFLELQPIEVAAKVYSHINPDVSTSILEKMRDDYFTKIIIFLDPYLLARLLSRLEKEKLQSKLSQLPQKLEQEINAIISFPPNTAGYIVDTKAITFYPENTVEEVLQRVRRLKERRIVNIYVINTEGELVGVIPLQEIAVSDPHDLLSTLISGAPLAINCMAPLEDVVKIMEDRKIINLPVVDAQNILIGVIRYNTLVKTAKEDVSDDAQTMFGAGRDEKALSKISFAIRKRLPWLEINLVTAFLAASVVGFFEDTIAKITILAVFLPVVAGQSGNTGSQALAVTIRGLALREIRPRQWFKIARKEVLVGLFNGLIVGITTSLIVYIWTGSVGLPIVIGVSMILSMSMAGLSGAVIPMILQSIGQDPAQSSSIILTTVTDVVGFLSFLGLATIMSIYLGIV